MTPRTLADAVGRAFAREWRLLSSGQRWTAGLALALGASVLAFGLPTPLDISISRPAAAGPASPRSSTARSAEPGGTAEAADLIDATAIDPASGPPTPSGSVPSAPTATRPKVVLIAAPPGPLPGPSDADAARAFRDAAGLDADLLVLDGAGACALGLEPGTLVVTSLGLGAEARTCLVNTGAVVLGHDSAGQSGPSPAGGWNLSTARGDVDSLLDLTRWGRATNRLAGKVGVVASSRVVTSVVLAVPMMKRLGVDVVRTLVLDEGPAGEAQVTEGVSDFAAAGVDTVILAATAEHQRSWSTRAALLAPNVRHLVSDLAGSMFDEVRPPTFAGALAHTSLRVPWFERKHGATAAQQRCRATWAAGAPQGPALVAVEEHRVFAWCQHIELVTAALASGGSVVDALRRAAADSPLTSPIGPLADGTWGPSLDAVLAYDGACGCWTESRALSPRPEAQ